MIAKEAYKYSERQLGELHKKNEMGGIKDEVEKSVGFKSGFCFDWVVL